MAGKTGRLRHRVAETLELPKDVVMDVPKVTIIGNIQMSIENHQGVMEYSSSKIRINTSTGVYRITGSDLIIKSIVTEEIVITGDIENIDISG